MSKIMRDDMSKKSYRLSDQVKIVIAVGIMLVMFIWSGLYE